MDAGELAVVDVPVDKEGNAGGGIAMGTLLARVWQKRRRSGSSWQASQLPGARVGDALVMGPYIGVEVLLKAGAVDAGIIAG